MNRKIISEILSGTWSINSKWADAHLPLIVALLNGSTNLSFTPRTGNEGTEMPFSIDPSTMQRSELFAWDDYKGRYAPNPNIPQNSVGIIPFTGPLTYYNGDCGEPGMIQRTNWLMDMQRRDNISAIVQLIDTPGGISTAVPNYIAEMKKSSKPILSYVDNMCASLGMWFSSASDETYTGHEFSEMGSVGSYCMLLDFKSAMEAEGYKVVEVYAPQSTDKNKAYKDAIAGDDSLIKEDLRIHVDAFIKHIKENRPASAANEAAWNSGKMFYANDAKKLGLSDGIKPFSQVVSKAAWLAKRK